MSILSGSIPFPASAVRSLLARRRRAPSPAGDALSRLYPIAKRGLDLAAAVVLLILTAPVWLAIALAVRLDSPGPVLFRQVRVGRDGRHFVVFKFRSMHVNNDDGVHRKYVEAFMASGAPSEIVDGKPVYKLTRDPRVTRVGRILRKTSLDELPQLLNVFRGEMSLVGPRPALPWEVEKYEPWQMRRLDVTPGITGMWQVYGRSRVTFEEMVRMDVEYAARPSLRQDLKLIALTLPAVLFGYGAA